MLISFKFCWWLCKQQWKGSQMFNQKIRQQFCWSSGAVAIKSDKGRLSQFVVVQFSRDDEVASVEKLKERTWAEAEISPDYLDPSFDPGLSSRPSHLERCWSWIEVHPPVGVGTLCYQISTSGGLDSLDFTIAIGYLGTEVSGPEVTLTLIWTKVLGIHKVSWTDEGGQFCACGAR